MIDIRRIALAGLDTPAMQAIRGASEAAQRGAAPRPSFVPPRYDPTPDLIAAALAGGMIAAGGRAVTAEEAVGVFREVREALAAELREDHPS